jgi:hypothetical protein
MGDKENPIVGSLINGLGTNAIAGNDVRKGLMINAALLAGSGGLSGLGAGATQVAGTGSALTNAGASTGLGMAGSAAGTAGTGTTLAGTGSALTGAGASTAANTAFMNPAGVSAGTNTLMGASQAAPVATTAAPANLSTLLEQGLSPDLALDAANAAGTTGGYTGYGMAGNPAANMTFLDKLGAGANAVGQYAQQNPVLTQMAVQTAQQMLQQPQRQASPPGLLRGNQIQASAPQYQLDSPKVSLI